MFIEGAPTPLQGRAIPLRHPSCIQHGANPSPYPLPSAFLTLGGEQILFTNSFAESTMLFCVQVTSEVLGEVLVVEQDGADRVRRVQVHANVHGA